ncbi:MAG: septal ring lytic transglycosylase RlpA family protein [Rickettsiales bacterium]|nr:septal ring lytic transglycosylase RlpA family protein [Rickettsiales bacterium]
MNKYLLLILPIIIFSCESNTDFDRVKSRYSNIETVGELIEQEEIDETSTIQDALDGTLAKQVKFKNGKYRGYYKIGKPYQIYGITYTPKDFEELEQTGVASWYGDAFHGKKTANGEIYNKGDMTAAHRTLPMPSLVRVTNLANDKSVIVRVNDRGPFAKNRIIDLSQKAAEILEYKNKGVTAIKVELLKEDTEELLKELGLK